MLHKNLKPKKSHFFGFYGTHLVEIFIVNSQDEPSLKTVSLDIYNKNNFNFHLACSLHDFVGYYIGYAIKFNKYDGIP